MGYDYNNNPMMNTNIMPVSEQNNESAIAREVAQVQAAMTIAQRFPRNEALVEKKIEQACSRLRLASSACYTYSRGGTDIQGPSIRLAEALARAFGNIKYGVEEVSQLDGESKMRAYAYDLETNTQAERIFVVKHERTTKKGTTKLTDSRDIYESNANQGARRLRSCILELIPADLVELAIEKCEQTVRANIKITPDTINAMLEAFKAYGITVEMIEAFIQRKMQAITTDQFLKLRNIWAGLRDGITKPEDFFDLSIGSAPKKAAETIEARKVEDMSTKAEERAEGPSLSAEDNIPMDAGFGYEENGPESYVDDSEMLYDGDDLGF